MKSAISYAKTLILLSGIFLCGLASAASTIYTNVTSFKNDVPVYNTIKFDKFDDGTPINTQFYPSLTLQGVNFSALQAYYQQAVYVGPGAVLRVTMPPGTTAYGSNISPFYDVAGNYNINVSIGGVVQNYSVPRQGTWFDFFGITSTQPIDYIEFSHPVGDMTLFETYFHVSQIPFIAFSPYLALTYGPNGTDGSFAFGAQVTLSASAKVFDAANDTITLKVGGVSTVLAPGSFKAAAYGTYVYTGLIGGEQIAATIKQVVSGTYVVGIAANNVNVTGVVNPVPVSLTIGSNIGIKAVQAYITPISIVSPFEGNR